MFDVGDRVRLAERLRSHDLNPNGTVIESGDGDVVVRWDTGLDAALAPESLEAADPTV